MSENDFIYTKKQNKAFDLLNNKKKIFYLFDGSSRSGKTILICKWLILYGFGYKGINILIARYNFSHAKASVWNQTLIPLLKQYYPGLYKENKSDHIITMESNSTITLGGLEEGDRLDKILGTEWAIIFVNEATENSFSTYQTLITRLNSKAAPVKFVMDCNPRAPSHWLNKQFIQKVNFETKNALTKREINTQVRLHWDVRDNKVNLSKTYIYNLGNLTGIKRKRFFQGIWADAAEGGVYRFSRTVNHVDEPIKYIDGAIIWTGWDFGIADNVFIIWAQFIPVPKTEKNKTGVEIQIFDEYYNNNKDYKYYANVVNGKPYKNVRHAGDPSGVKRNAALTSWFILLKTCGIYIRYRTRITVADHISNANLYMPAVRVCENQCPKVVEMFENWTFPKNKDGKVVEGELPEHNEYSHPGTAFYYKVSNVYPPIKNQFFLP